jgi:hypothetical protein
MHLLRVPILLSACALFLTGCGLTRQSLSPDLRTLAHEYGVVTIPGRDESINFQARAITDEQFAKAAVHLRRYGGVEQLDLNGQIGITNQSIPTILTLKQIRELHLEGTSVNLEGLQALASLPRLGTLFIEQGRFGADEISQLRGTLPGVEVIESNWIRDASWRQ